MALNGEKKKLLIENVFSLGTQFEKNASLNMRSAIRCLNECCIVDEDSHIRTSSLPGSASTSGAIIT